MTKFDRNLWHSLFKDSCFETKSTDDIPDSFYEYLKEDGIILGGTIPEYSLSQRLVFSADRSGLSDSDSDSSSDLDCSLPPNQRFPQFHDWISATIRELGGKVMPKMGSVSPKVLAQVLNYFNFKGWNLGIYGRKYGVF